MLIKDYHEFSMSRTGILSNINTPASYGIHFKIDGDAEILFPYIKAENKDAVVYSQPPCVQFLFECCQCRIYPGEVIALPFRQESEAKEFIDLLISFLNRLYERRDKITPNHKTFNQVSVPDLLHLLPGSNCGECGFLTCIAFAAHLSVSEAAPSQCPHFTRPIREKKIYPIYDNQGKLVSTVTIEAEPDPGDNNQTAKEARMPIKISTTGVHAELSPRETQVLSFIAGGATNREVSEKLSISQHTVKSHIIHIFNKLGVNDRTQAAVWAAKNNLI